ncbi:hypothetical protein ACHQM5_020162 [Ranunculus cassubicifolius]
MHLGCFLGDLFLEGIDLTCLDANHYPSAIIILFGLPNAKRGRKDPGAFANIRKSRYIFYGIPEQAHHIVLVFCMYGCSRFTYKETRGHMHCGIFSNKQFNILGLLPLWV